MNPADPIGGGGSVQFLIYVNDRQVWSSGFVRANSSLIAVDIDLRGANKLTLVVTDAGDGVGHDWAVWADPVIR